MMADYQSVARQLGRVRRAWKRTASLSGLAVVLVEVIGMFTFVLLVDILYRPGLGGRVALLVLSLAAVVYLVVRHVLRPLVRRISDEQIALYVEEHNSDFEGALMSAAEFGPGLESAAGDPKSGGVVSGQERAIVEAIIGEAVARSKRFGLAGAISLSRLRKYGVAAAAAILLYFGIGLLAPKVMRAHATRVLVPWREGPGPIGGAREDLGPITFILSSYDTRLLRGTPFDLKAKASRAPARPVLFHFRPLAEMSDRDDDGPPELPAVSVIGEDGERDPAWRTLVMEEIEELHGYRIALPDVNEDIAFFVSTGAFSSGLHRIEVYDPLRLQGFEVGVEFPGYLRMPDELNERLTGDVSVPEGSTVTVRVITNGRLEGGELLWANGETQELSVSDGRPTSAATSFQVSDDRSYNFTVRDVYGQELPSRVPALVHAIKDMPPTLEVMFPKLDISAHPLAEVAFRVEAKDDWGVVSVELIYRLGIERDAPSVRIPLEIGPFAGGRGGTGQRTMAGVKAAHDMLFETFEPALSPGDLMTYHFEARDRRGQRAISDIFFILIKPFEVWGTWERVASAGGGGEMAYVPAALEKYAAAVWHVHAQKDRLSREEYERACRKLADGFISEGTNLWDYVRYPP